MSGSCIGARGRWVGLDAVRHAMLARACAAASAIAALSLSCASSSFWS